MKLKHKQADGSDREVEYQVGKLSPRQQFHVARRLAPIQVARVRGFAAMASAFAGLEPKKAVEGEADPALNDETFGSIAAAGSLPVARAIAAMTDADADYVITTCLAVVTRQDGAGWAPIQNPTGNLNYSDIDMEGMMALVQVVVKEQCGSFFLDPSGSVETSKAA